MREKEIANAVEVKAPASENVGLPHAEIAEAIHNEKNTDDVFARQISKKDKFILGVNRQELCNWRRISVNSSMARSLKVLS